jgi:hypothetical protein
MTYPRIPGHPRIPGRSAACDHALTLPRAAAAASAGMTRHGPVDLGPATRASAAPSPIEPASSTTNAITMVCGSRAPCAARPLSWIEVAGCPAWRRELTSHAVVNTSGPATPGREPAKTHRPAPPSGRGDLKTCAGRCVPYARRRRRAAPSIPPALSAQRGCVPRGGPGTQGRRHRLAFSRDRQDHGCWRIRAHVGYRLVAPFGLASHAHRARADGHAAAAHPPPDDPRRQPHAVRRADEGACGSDRPAASARRPAESLTTWRA